MKKLLTLLFAMSVMTPSFAQQKATGTVSKGETQSAETVHLYSKNKKVTKKTKPVKENAAKKKAATKKTNKVWK